MSIRTINLNLKLGAIAACLFIGIFWASMPLLGWSHYSLEGAYTSCSVEWRERSLSVTSYNITIFGFVYLVPVIVIVFTNARLLTMVNIFVVVVVLTCSFYGLPLKMSKHRI